jgi:hypothetical protein
MLINIAFMSLIVRVGVIREQIEGALVAAEAWLAKRG